MKITKEQKKAFERFYNENKDKPLTPELQKLLSNDENIKLSNTSFVADKQMDKELLEVASSVDIDPILKVVDEASL